MVTGLRPDTSIRLLELWADYLLDGSVVLPGETLETGPWLLEAVAVQRPQEHLLIAHRFYGEQVRGLQLVWADDGGRWPCETGHRARRAGQPILGPRAPWFCAEHAPRLDAPPHL